MLNKYNAMGKVDVAELTLSNKTTVIYLGAHILAKMCIVCEDYNNLLSGLAKRNSLHNVREILHEAWHYEL